MSRQKTTPEKRSGGNGTPAKGDGADRLPAYFLSLSLENVRCFGPKQTLDLSDGHGKPARWTVILGINGTGKTTLLQCLASFNHTITFFHKSNTPPLKTTISIYGPRISGTAGNHSTVVDFDPKSFLRTSEELTPAKCNVHYITASGLEPREIVPEPDECSWERTASGARVTSRAEPMCYAYGSGRRLGSASLSGSQRDDPAGTLFDEHATLRSTEEWLLRLDYSSSKPSDVRAQQIERLDQVKRLLISILPDVEDIRFTIPSGPNPTPRVEFRTFSGWVPLRQLGYGYQTVIAWVTDFANRMVERYPDSPDPLAEPAVVLVDEIDLHLHPVWQRKLMGFLTERFPNTQFIATAHSPLVAQAAADANLAVLRREGDHVVIDNDVDDIRNWRIDQILTSDLFGLETARPPWVEALIQERNKLLDKSKLTAAEKKRLAELNAEVEELPFGETKQERDARDQIKKTLDLLMGERKPAS